MIFGELLILSKKPIIPSADFSVLLSRKMLEAKEIFHTRENTFYAKITQPNIHPYYLIGLINSSYFLQLYRHNLSKFSGNTRATFLNLPFKPLNPNNKEDQPILHRIIYGTQEILKIQQEMDLAEDCFLREINTFQPKPEKGALQHYLLEKNYGILLDTKLENLSHIKIQELIFEEEISQGLAGEDLHFGQTFILNLSYRPKGETICYPLLRWQIKEENLKLFLLFAVPQGLRYLQGKTGLKEKITGTKELLSKIQVPYWSPAKSDHFMANYNHQKIIQFMEIVKKQLPGIINPSLQKQMKAYIESSVNQIISSLYT